MLDTPRETAEWGYVKGLAEEKKGDAQAALRAYEKAVEADPNAWEAACNATHLAMKHGLMDRAAAVFNRVPAELKRIRPQLLFNEAVFFKNMGHYQEVRDYVAYLREHGMGVMDDMLAELEADLPGGT
jgi:tetratricopeptide (TPR) repeat protein